MNGRHRNINAVKNHSEAFFRRAYDGSVMGLQAGPLNGRLIETELGVAIDFVSCSYLGLDRHPHIRDAAIDAIAKFGGIQWSCARTRLNHFSLSELESRLNALWDIRSIAFTTVSAANAAALPLLAAGLFTNGEKPVCVFEKRAHASLQFLKPIVAEETEVATLDSTHCEELESLCRRHKQIAFITDGVNSMGGAADISSLVRLQDRYGLFLYVDDAHGTSIQGKNGCGFALSQLPVGSQMDNTIVAVSQSKGFGSTGGTLLVSSEEKENVIRRYGQPYAFSVAPSIPAIASSIASAEIHSSTELTSMQTKLAQNIRHFDSLIDTPYNGNGLPIRMIKVGPAELAVDWAATLLSQGYYVSAVFFPTVARDKAQLRICLSAAHTSIEIQALCTALKQLPPR